MSDFQSKFLKQLKAKTILSNKDRVRACLSITQHKKGWLRETPSFSKDSFLQIQRPQPCPAYLSGNMEKREIARLERENREVNVECLLRFKALSKKLAKAISVPLVSCQIQTKHTTLKQCLFIQASDQQKQEIPLFYKTVIPGYDSPPKVEMAVDRNVWEALILLREQTKASLNLKEYFSIIFPSLKYPLESSSRPHHLMDRALAVNQIFSLTQFHHSSPVWNDQYQTFSCFYLNQVYKYFCSWQYAKQLQQSICSSRSKVIEELQVVYFPEQIITPEKYEMILNRGQIKQPQPDIKPVLISLPVPSMNFAVKQRESKNDVKEQGNTGCFEIPNFRIHHVDKMSDVTRLVKASKPETFERAPHQFKRQQKNEIRHQPQKYQKQHSKPQSRPKFSIKNRYNNSDNQMNLRGRKSVIDNLNIHGVIYNVQSRKHLLERLDLQYPKRSKVQPEKKKTVTLEENQDQIDRSIRLKQEIKKGIVARVNKHLIPDPVDLPIPPSSPSLSSSSQASSFSSFLPPSPKKKIRLQSSKIKIEFPIRIDNLIVQQKQAFLEYQLHQININSFQRNLKEDYRRFECLNVRVWISSRHMSSRERQKIETIEEIVERLEMDLYFGETGVMRREESTMSHEDILKLQGAACYSKSSVFEVAWQMSDEQE